VSALKKLAGQTAVYGLPSIIGRVLNYFLVPLYTLYFEPKEYGIVSEFYAYVAFFTVLLLLGMETTFFRFVNKSSDKEKTFNQTFSIVLVVGLLFLISTITFSQNIANWMGYPDLYLFVICFSVILFVDAISSLLLAKLRYQEESKRFAFIQFSNISVNIILNIVFICFLMQEENDPIGIGYIFIANLLASLTKPILLFKDVIKIRFVMNKDQVKTMLIYALPLMAAGFAGIINETFDRIMIKRLLASVGQEYAQTQVGIYSANYKLSILISLFIQAYRYAAEPFFFAQEKQKGGTKVYAKTMTYFVIIVTSIFLLISLNLDLFKWFIPNDAYWEGLVIVPILLLANVFLGIYYNQSIWYKLSNKTKYGAFIALGGATITIVLNLILIPILGYLGAAITTLFVYVSMTIASYYWGQKHYPIKYNLRKVGLYLFSSILLTIIGHFLTFDSTLLTFFIHLFLFGIFIAIVFIIERPLQALKSNNFN